MSVTVIAKKCKMQFCYPGNVSLALPGATHIMNLRATSVIGRALQTVVALQRISLHSLLATTIFLLQRHSSRRNDIYNLLWAVVFGFATLNILSLATRKFEPNRRGLTFGELMAVLVVLLSMFLLGWEMLNLFHIFPIKLQR